MINQMGSKLEQHGQNLFVFRKKKEKQIKTILFIVILLGASLFHNIQRKSLDTVENIHLYHRPNFFKITKSLLI